MTIPPLTAAIGVEMIRDGGSLAVEYESEGCGRFILFVGLVIGDGHERLGYSDPVLIDCDPTKRSPDTPTVIYGKLCGPAERISWAVARSIVAAFSERVMGLDQIHARWLKMLQFVTANDGAVPPEM